jgi:hypothetical protein
VEACALGTSSQVIGLELLVIAVDGYLAQRVWIQVAVCRNVFCASLRGVIPMSSHSGLCDVIQGPRLVPRFRLSVSFFFFLFIPFPFPRGTDGGSNLLDVRRVASTKRVDAD